MAWYHFHFRMGPLVGLDHNGTQCLGIEDAIAQAFLVALDKVDLISDSRRELGVIEVADEAGMHRFSLPLSSVVSDLDPALLPARHTDRGAGRRYAAIG